MQNRHDVRERFRTIVQRALVPPKKRVGTKPSRASKEKRLSAKKRRGDIKRNRKVRPEDL
jgi:ribosome-associated protein